MKDEVNYLIGQKDGLIHSLELLIIQEERIKKDIESIDKEINKKICKK